MENISEKNVLPTKILVEPAKAEEKKLPSGIVIPDVVESPTSRGTILLIGSKVEDVKIGNNVMYSPNAVIKVKFGDDIYHLLSYQDILLWW